MPSVPTKQNIPPILPRQQSPHEIAQPSLPPIPTSWSLNHIFDENGKQLSIDDLLKGPMAATWHAGLEYESGRLSSGLPGTHITGTKTIDFISKDKVPKGACITYANMVCD